jgi:hypothetical protein
MMAILAWVFAAAAIGLQLLNVVWAIRSPRSSQIYLAPVVLWYVALVLRGKGFFLSSSGEEITWVLVVHIVVSALLFGIGKVVARPQ